MSGRPRWELAVLAGLAVCLLAAYINGTGATLADTDEVIYAEFIRAMHRGGDYLTLRYEGIPTHQRPPFPVTLYALVAAAVPGELGLRLVPVVFSALVALGCGILVWRHSRGLAAGLFAMLIAAGAPTYFTYGRLLLSDPPFVAALLATLAATMAAQRDARYVTWAAGALGLAFATKSIAAGIPAVALAPFIARAAFRHRGSPRFSLWRPVAAFVVTAAPFYLVGILRYGGDFIDGHILYNLLQRAGGDLQGIGIGGPLAYIEHLWTIDGPVWLALVIGAPVVAVVVGVRGKDTDLIIPGACALTLLVLLSLVGTRLPHYLLPMFPAAAICAGLLAARASDALRRRSALIGWLPAVCALALFTRTLAMPLFDPALAPAERALGLAHHAEVVPADQPIYSLDWYTPALGYYADRPWRYLTTHQRAFDIVGSVDIFRAAGTAQLVPPFPAGKTLYIAGRAEQLATQEGLAVLRVIERIGEGAEGFVLVEARAAAASK